MSKNLIIIESPNKIKSFAKYLGSDYDIIATKGHIMDLPPKKIGVDLTTFSMDYEILTGKKSIIDEIIKKGKIAEHIYIMTDPDREGSGIASCVYKSLPKTVQAKCKRASTIAITKNAIQEALRNAGEIDHNLVSAFEARRVIDRLVGYKISPIMWVKGIKGASAGRVQSVALKYVVDRDREIEAFKSDEYWDITATCDGYNPKLWGIDGDEKTIDSAKLSNAIKKVLMEKSKQLKIVSIDKKTRKREAPPPFITSSLQQAANSILGWPVDKTMNVAQEIFSKGCITYHRTDSVEIDKDHITSLRDDLLKKYGQKYVSETPNSFKSKKASQEAHEAIRPTGESPKDLTGDELKLYNLIQSRYLASQMAEAVFDQVTIEFTSINTSHIFNFNVHGSKQIFDGFLKSYGSAINDVILPDLKVGDEVTFSDIVLLQKFTQPPSRYSDASLVKKMETDGIGRPATYAATIQTLLKRAFIIKDGKTFKTTDLGKIVNDYLVKFFPDFVDPIFTSNMEDKLDDIADGKHTYLNTLKDFYDPFKEVLKKASSGDSKDIFKTTHRCPQCNEGFLLKKPDKNGWWYPCERYPECKTVALIDDKEVISVKVSSEVTVDAGVESPQCPKCEGTMTLREGKYGKFWGCNVFRKGCKGLISYVDPDKVKEEDVSYKGLVCSECESNMIQTKGKFGEYMKCIKTGCKGSSPIPIGKCPTCEKWALKRHSKKKKCDFYCCMDWPDKCGFISSTLKDVK